MAAVLAPAGIAPRSGSTGRPHDRSAPAPLLAAVGLEDVSQDTVAKMTTVDQKLFLVELVDNMRDAILEGKAATASERCPQDGS
jgi:hypothetical protein